MAEPPVTFAELLRQLRTGAGLTQEELAEAAGLGVLSIGDLERGAFGSGGGDARRGQVGW